MGTGTLEGVRRILLVEDHAGTASALTWLLRRQGYVVDEARSLAAATNLTAVDGVVYDLLLCDVGLPDGSGCDLMAGIRARGATTRGVVMSGFTDDATLRAARDAGFDRFLAKPVSFPDVLAAIDDVLAPTSPATPQAIAPV
jgi:DNA-binding response OmpR family regulator